MKSSHISAIAAFYIILCQLLFHVRFAKGFHGCARKQYKNTVLLGPLTTTRTRSTTTTPPPPPTTTTTTTSGLRRPEWATIELKQTVQSFSDVTILFDYFFQTQPYLATFLTCAAKGSAADFVAQVQTHEKRNEEELKIDQIKVSFNHQMQDPNQVHQEMDFCRNLAFILYGGFYQGMGQTFLYTHLYPYLVGTEPTISTVLTQASIDNFVLAPFFCLPTVYTIKSVLAGGTAKQGIAKYMDHIQSQWILLRYWSVWMPVQCINFGLVPEHLRVPFGAMFSFFWMCVLSTVSSKSTAGADATTVTTGQLQEYNSRYRKYYGSLELDYLSNQHSHPTYSRRSTAMAGHAGHKK